MTIKNEGRGPTQETRDKETGVAALIDKTISGLNPVFQDYFDNDEMKGKIRKAVEEKVALVKKIDGTANIEGFVQAAINTQKRDIVFEKYEEWMEAQEGLKGNVVVKNKFYNPSTYNKLETIKLQSGKPKVWIRAPFNRIEFLMEERMDIGSEVVPRKEGAKNVRGLNVDDEIIEGGKIETITYQGMLIFEGQKGLKEPFLYELAE